MTTAVLRSAQAGAILTALGLSVGLMTGPAEAEPRTTPGKHLCTSPIFPGGENWVDLNLRYNVSERIIGPPAARPTSSPGCLEVFVGERWVRAVPPWITATPTEQQAFFDKFLSARYVIDEGVQGKEQSIVVSDKKKLLFQGTVPDLEGLTPPWTKGLPFIVPVSPPFNPFNAPSIGKHTIILKVNMSEQVCNGLPGDIGEDLNNPKSPPAAPGLNKTCLPAGESPWPITATFTKPDTYNPTTITVSQRPTPQA